MPIPIDDILSCSLGDISSCSLKQEDIDNLITEIQEASKLNNIKDNSRKLIGKISKPKHTHMNEKYIPYAKKDYHKLEYDIRQLEIRKTDLERKASTLRRRNNINKLNKINEQIIHTRDEIEKAVYMRLCIFKEIRNVPGYDKFANKKCEFFFTNIGCLNGDACPYRH
jgi:hypothetical protein